MTTLLQDFTRCCELLFDGAQVGALVKTVSALKNATYKFNPSDDPESIVRQTLALSFLRKLLSK